MWPFKTKPTGRSALGEKTISLTCPICGKEFKENARQYKANRHLPEKRVMFPLFGEKMDGRRCLLTNIYT